tara:strand:+ start:524 stop:2248 length:1725 start_codon:yes stop_codon:yes gene_type:complete
MPIPKINRELLPSIIPEEILTDFRNHLHQCMKYLGLGEPTPLQYMMAERLQSGSDEFQLQAGRGAGKSVLTSMFASWLLLRDPDHVIMVLSATAIKSTEFVSMTRKILTLVPYMKHLEPGPNTPDSAFGFNVECKTKTGQDKSVYSRGISSQITGSHADTVILDDVEIEKNSETAEAREKLLNKVWEIEQIRNPGKGLIRILGTPQSSESIYNKLRDAYPCYKFPAIVPNPDIPGQIVDVDAQILEMDKPIGESTQPERFPNDLLSERKARIGPKLFSLHYHLDTSLADQDRYPLRLNDLVVLDLDHTVHPDKIVWSSEPVKNMPSFGLNGDVISKPMWASDTFTEYKHTVMHIDPSGRGTDETAVCIASFGNGYIWIHELVGFDGGYEDAVLQKIVKLALEYPLLNLIRYEENYGDGMFGSLLRPHVGRLAGSQIGVEGYRVTGMKESRIINTLEPVMSQHRLCMSKKCIRQEETQRQITRLYERRGALKHDDRVDVLAATVGYFENTLGIDVDEVIAQNEHDAQMQIIASWEDDKRRAGLLLGDRISGASRIKTLNPAQVNRTIFSQRKRNI